MTIDGMITEVLRREGKFSNDPPDPPTKYGITIGTLRHTTSLDATVADLKALTEDQARAIYKTHYWSKPHINLLVAPVQPAVFDFYVNSGAQAVETLQALLNAFGQTATVDGRIGPKTADAVRVVWGRAGTLLVDAYAIERRNFFYRLADRRPASRKYARRGDGGKGGWIRRAEEFMSPRFRLSEAAHKERTSGWA